MQHLNLFSCITFRKWINNSYHYWEDLKNTEHGAKAGVKEVSGYIFSHSHPSIVRNHYMEKLVPIYRPATELELKLCPGNWKYGSFYSTILTEGSMYLPWAMQKLVNGGSKVRKQYVDNLSALGSQYDVVVNCTGLGAKYLAADDKMVPIRGQVIKVRKNVFN